MNKDRRAPISILIALLVLATLISLPASLVFGSAEVPPADVWAVVQTHIFGGPEVDTAFESIVWELRAPRALLSVIVGAGLAVSGVAMQTLVRNPLADPYLLGVSAGASVGATAVITLGAFASFGVFALTVGALVGAVLASMTVYLVSVAQGGLTPLRLVLSGVVLSAAFSAIASFLIFKAPDSRAAEGVLFWMLGSVGGAEWSRLLFPAIVVTLGILAMLAISSRLDAVSAGPDTATALGVNVKVMRGFLFLVQALMVGTLVSVAGGIGFVGLVLPHVGRLLVGSLHRRLIPISALAGGLFLLWVDVLSRVAARPQEIPLGVVTGVIGAPLFLVLMGRTNYRFGAAK